MDDKTTITPETPELIDHGPPYIGAALICDRIIDAKDNTVSLIRLIDTLTVSVPQEAPEIGTFKIPLELSIFIQVRDCEPEDLAQLGGITWNTDGRPKRQGPFGLEIPATSDLRIYNMNLQLTLHVDKPGVYYVGIEFGNRMLTRIPLRVQLVREQPTETIDEWEQLE